MALAPVEAGSVSVRRHALQATCASALWQGLRSVPDILEGEAVPGWGELTKRDRLSNLSACYRSDERRPKV